MNRALPRCVTAERRHAALGADERAFRALLRALHGAGYSPDRDAAIWLASLVCFWQSEDAPPARETT